jgi:hypothetical protein
MNCKLPWLPLAVTALVLGACSSNNSSAPTPPPVVQSAKMSGSVDDAFVVNATVTAYEVSAAGATLACVPAASGGCTTATTDANGNYTITVSGYTGPVLLQATGGTYTDTVTGQTISIPATLTLSVLEPAVTAGSTYTDQLTGLTTMIANQALSMMSQGQSASAAVTAATTAVQSLFGVANPAVTALLNLAEAKCGTAAADQASFDVSLILAGVAQLASQYNVTSADLSQALIIDYTANGGVLKGTLPGGAAIPVGSQAIPLATIEGSSLAVSLYQAIKTYIASVANACGAVESATQAAALAASSAQSASQQCADAYYCYLVNINYSGPPGVFLGFGATLECTGNSFVGVPNGISTGVNVGGTGSLSGQAVSAALTTGSGAGNFVDSCGTTTMTFTAFANSLQTPGNQGVTCTFSGPVMFSSSDMGYHNTAKSVETVVCTLPTPPTYTVSGSVSGLASGTMVTVSDSVNGDSAVVSVNGPFTLAALLGTGASYNVQAVSSSTSQQCAVTSGSGTIAAANVTNVAISCSTSVGGTAPSVYVVDSTSTLFAFDANGIELAHAALSTPVNNLNGGGITTDANNVYVAVGATANGPLNRTPGAILAFNKITLAPVTLPAGSFSNVATPRGIIYDSHNSQFYIGNGGSHVTVYNASGTYLSAITSNVYGPSGVAFDSVDHTIWVANDTNGNANANLIYAVSEFNENGTAAQTIDPATQFRAPVQPNHVLPYAIGYCPPVAGGSAYVAVGFLQDNLDQDPQGSLGVSQGGVYSITGTTPPVGSLIAAFSPQLAPTAQPNAISCSSTGSIYVAANDALHIYSTAGTAIALPSGGFGGLTAPIFGVYANY